MSNPAKLKAVREVVAANAPPALPREPGKASPLRRLSRGSTGESDAGLAHTWTSGIERGGSGKEKKRLASTAPAAVLGLGKRSPSAVLAALDGRPPGGGGNGLARSPTAGGGKEQWGEIEDPPPKARGKRGASPGRGRGGSSEGSRGVGDEVLGPVISALGGKDWRERCTGLTDLGALLDEQSPAAVEASVMAIADGLAPRMTDANSKVSSAV